MKWNGVVRIITAMYLLHAVPGKCQDEYYNEEYIARNWIIEAGTSGGIMNCLTDLGGHKGTGRGFIKDLNWEVSRICYNVFAGIKYKGAIGLVAVVTSGNVASSDKLLQQTEPDLRGRYGRNLSF